MRPDLRTTATLFEQWAFLLYQGLIRRDPTSYLFSRFGRQDPYPLYNRIRAEAPLARSTTGVRVSADHAVVQEMLRSRKLSADAGDATVVDLSLLTLDPPDHTRLRRLVAGSFAPGRVRDQEPRIAEAVERLLDQMEGQLREGPVDLMATFAKPLPTFMIASLMGIPDADLTTLGRHGNAVGRVLDGLRSIRDYRAAIAARRQLDELFGQLADLKRQQPGPDVISDLVTVLDRGELSRDEFNSLCSLVLIAGFETTVNLIGNAVSALLDRPVIWRRLIEDPDLADAVVDETLRWDSPVQVTGRMAIDDVELAGTIVPKRATVIGLLGGANRDPRVFERPEIFDIDRPNAHEHLSFGHGIHHCLGRPLAMMEARLALRALARRLPDLHRAGAEKMADTLTLRGRARLPIRLGQGERI